MVLDSYSVDVVLTIVGHGPPIAREGATFCTAVM